MASTPSFLDLAKFGQQSLSMGEPVTDSPLVGAKKADLTQVSMIKKATLGAAAEQRVIATAMEQGTSMSEEEWAQDLETMNPLQLARKYGDDAALDRVNYARARSELADEKSERNGFGREFTDKVLGIASGAVATAGGAASLLTNATDQVLNRPLGLDPVSPLTAKGTQRVTGAIEGLQSDVLKNQKEQNALEGELMRQDRQTQYESDVAENAGGDLWDRTIEPMLAREAGNAGDFITNLGDQPSVATDIIAKATGSMGPSTGAIRAIGSLRAARFGTEAADEMVAVAPLVTALTESGGAISQTQVEIMSMSEAQLMESESYKAMRDGGMDHQTAQLNTARDAGSIAGISALPVALVGGMATARFDAAPLSPGRGGAVTGAVRNTVKEPIEEGLQEANSQVASNLALDTVGIETELFEGTGEAAAAGAVGGAGTSAVLQAPGAVLGGLKITGQGAAKVAIAGSDRLEERRDAKRDLNPSNPIGSPAREAAATEIEATAQTVTQSLPETSGSSRRVMDAAVVSPEETVEMVASYPGLVDKVKDGQVRRADIVEAADTVLRDKKADKIDKSYAAIDALIALDTMRRATGDDARAEVEALEEGNVARTAYKSMVDKIATYEASPVRARVEEIVKSLTPEEVQELILVGTDAFAEQDDATKAKLIKAAGVIARVNPLAFKDDAQFETALAQVGDDAETRTALELAREIVANFRKVDAASLEIKKDANTDRFKGHKSVQDDVEVLNNRYNGLPSLLKHYREVNEPMAVGRKEQAQAKLDELTRFAKSQVNKMIALNTSATSGTGRDGRVEFQAYNGTSFFQQKGVWVTAGDSLSVAQARQTFVDAQATVNLATKLAEAHGLELTETLPLPDMHESYAMDSIRIAPETAAAQTFEADPLVRANALVEKDPEDTPMTRSMVKAESKAVQAELRTLRQEMKEMREANPVLRRARPLAAVLKSMGGVDPEGDLGKALKESGITARMAPGLFKKDGLKSADNIGIEDLNASLPGISDFMDDAGNGYVDPNQLAELLGQEIEGNRLDFDGYGRFTEIKDRATELREVAKLIKTKFPKATSRQARAEVKVEAKETVSLWLDRFDEQIAFSNQDEENLVETVVTEGGTIDGAVEKTLEEISAEKEAADAQRELDDQQAAADREAAGEGDATTDGQDGAGEGTGEGGRDGADARATGDGDQQTSDLTVDTPPAPSVPSAPAAPEASVPSTPAGVAAVQVYVEELRDQLPKTTAKRNVVLDAFKPNKKGSLLVAVGDPAADLIERAGRVTELEGAIGRDLNEEETAAIELALTQELPKFVGRYEAAMTDLIVHQTENNARLNDEKFNGRNDRPSWIEMFNNMEVEYALIFPSSFPTNFINRDSENGFHLETRAIQAAFMATNDWMTDQLQRQGRPMDNEQVSKMFGMGRTGRVSGDMKKFAQYGSPIQAASEAIARNMQDLLGLEAESDAAIKETQGLFRSMAASALQAMIDEGNLEISKFDYKLKDPATGKMGDRTMHSVRLSEGTKGSLAPLSRLGSPFGQIFVPGFEKARFVDQVPPRGKGTQMGNRFAEVSEVAQKVISRLEEQENFVNKPKLDFINAIGDKAYAKLLGFVELGEKPEERHNKVVLTSITSKNRSIERALSEAKIYAQEAEEIGGATGRAMNKVPIRFRWGLSSVGRLQQEGPVTPEGDKLMRELVSVTNSVLDLDNDKHVYALWLGVAQSLDLAVEKVIDHDIVIAQAEALVTEGGALYPAVEMLQVWLLDKEAGLDAEAFTQALAGQKVTPKFLHALLTVARVNQAQGTDEFNAFETALALEADGKTDGPINAIINMGTGAFTELEIEILAKGGLFFTSQEMSLNEFIRRENMKKGTEAEDLYHLAAARLRAMLKGKPSEQTLRIMRVLDALLPGFTLGEPNEDGEYDPQITRDIVKNPLTVFLYGSGEDGIAGKITDAMLDTLYKAFDEIAQGTPEAEVKLFKEHPNLGKDLAELMSVQSIEVELSDARTAELSDKSYLALRKAIKEHFAKPMLGAINQVTGGLSDNMKTMQVASQVQTLIFQDRYMQALVAQAEAENKGTKVDTKTGAGTERLSQASMDLAFQDLMSWAPIYSTKDQSFHIAAPEKTTVDRTVATSFDGTMKVRPSYLRPADASVKVSPYVTIGTGDGQMMLNIFSDPLEAFDRMLAVFDGGEMALDTVFEANRAINAAVYKGWMETNVYESLSQGYSQMTARLSEADYNTLSEDTKAAIFYAMTGEKPTKKDAMPTVHDVREIAVDLQRMSDRSAARKAAMKKMAVQVDHMAGSMSPHGVEGTVTPSNDPLNRIEIVNQLNDFAREEMEAIQARREEKANEPKTAGYAQAPSQALTNDVFRIGQRVPGHEGVVEISGKALITRIVSQRLV